MAGGDRHTDRTRQDDVSRHCGVVAGVSGGSGAGASHGTDADLVGRQPASSRGLDSRARQGSREEAPQPCIHGIGCPGASRRRARRGAASLDPDRSRRGSARRDQPPGRSRLAHPHGSRPADNRPVHGADVRLTTALPWLRVQPAVRRRRHGRYRQPGAARRGPPRRTPEGIDPRTGRLLSDSPDGAACGALMAGSRLADRDRRRGAERTIRSGRRRRGSSDRPPAAGRDEASACEGCRGATRRESLQRPPSRSSGRRRRRPRASSSATRRRRRDRRSNSCAKRYPKQGSCSSRGSHANARRRGSAPEYSTRSTG